MKSGGKKEGMPQKIVIDTNIWIKAIIDEEYTLECDDALSFFFRNKEMVLSLDYHGEM